MADPALPASPDDNKDDHSVQCGLPDWLIPTGNPHLDGSTQATATFDPHAPAAGAPRGTTALAMRSMKDRLDDRGVIARGGFGSIHKTLDKVLLRTVAMKVLEPPKNNPAVATLRFVEEAQITGQLDHPNIVPVHDLGINDDGRHFFTMKMVEGETLTKILKNEGGEKNARHLDHLLQIFTKVCDAISFAHSRGVVHRDLKPDNIMVGSFGQVYVMDWGIAQLLVGSRPSDDSGEETISRVHLSRDEGNVDAPGTIIGTFAYMAPEQALGMNAHIDQRTDVFALGAILYQMLTDQPPYTGGSAVEKIKAAQKGIIKPPAEVATGREVPPGLSRIAMKALKADPKERYQTVQELKEDVERFLRGGFWFATRSFAPGTVIVREGDDADAAYIITNGQCEAFKMEKAKKVSLRTMGPGDVFGETAIFTSKPRTASVRAITPLTAMVVTRESLEEELGLDSWMGAFVKALAGRFRELDAQHTHARVTTEDTRVASRVLEFLCLHGEKKENRNEGPWSLCLTQLTTEFGKTEADLSTIIQKTPNITIDKARNVVSVSRAAP